MPDIFRSSWSADRSLATSGIDFALDEFAILQVEVVDELTQRRIFEARHDLWLPTGDRYVGAFEEPGPLTGSRIAPGT